MRGQHGYSVFEVLIAFAIMAMVLGALLPGQAKLLARAASGEDQLLALDYAHSRLARLGVSEPIVVGKTITDVPPWRTTERVTARPSVRDGFVAYDILVIVGRADGDELARATSFRVLSE